MTRRSLRRVQVTTARGITPNPCFLPDGTRAVVKGLDSVDLENAGVHSLMVNAFHVAQRPGVNVVKTVGGLHRFKGWNGPIWTDSGGFQAFSLIRENAANGQVSDKGFTYRRQDKSRQLLTPAKSIANQWRLGSDVMFCLDECTHPEDSREVQAGSVRRTIEWAKTCKAEFGRRLDSLDRDSTTYRPLLFAVVQGGEEPDLRLRCAEALLEIGFDGFGFGGWPINDQGKLVDMVYEVSSLIPRTYGLHGLGIGRPDNIVEAWKAGYSTFDSALPTRDGRRGRLMVSPEGGFDIQSGSVFDYLFIADERFYRDDRPIDETCDCLCCTRYSRAYLHHLFRIGDTAAARLGTIHNLSFMSSLMDALRHDVEAEQARDI